MRSFDEFIFARLDAFGKTRKKICNFFRRDIAKLRCCRRGASNARLKEIQKQYDAIVPPNLGVGVWDDPKLLHDVPETQFDTSAITHKTIEMVGQYKPEIAARIQEAAPQLAQKTTAATAGRQAQMDALNTLKSIIV